MNNEDFFINAPWILVYNTLPLIVFAILCTVWAWICRTQMKKMIFHSAGGVLWLFIGIRLMLAFAIPLDAKLLTLSAMLYGAVMGLCALVFTVATVIAHRRGKELRAIEKSKTEAAGSDLGKTLQEYEDKLVAFGREHGFIH